MSFSSDVPRREPRRRLGRLKARRTAHLYQVDFGRGSEWAYYPGTDLLTLGTDRTAVFDPASDQWWIRPSGAGLLPIWLYNDQLISLTEFQIGREEIYTVKVEPFNVSSAHHDSNLQVNVDGSTIIFVTGGNGAGEQCWVNISHNGGQTWQQIQWADGTNTNWVGIWYSRWGDPTAARVIHLAAYRETGVVGTQGIYYNAFNVDTETVVHGASGIRTGNTSGGSPTSNSKTSFITATPSGDIYVFHLSPAASYRSDDGGFTWSAYTAYPNTTNLSTSLLALPDMSSDDNRDFLVIAGDNWLSGAQGHRVTLTRFDRSANAWRTMVTLFTGDTDFGGTFDISAVLDRATGHVKLVAFYDTTAPDDFRVRTWDIYGDTATERTDVPWETGVADLEFPNSNSICKIRNRIYVFAERFHPGTPRSVKIDYCYSDDDMVTWSGPFNWNTPVPDWGPGAERDIFGVWLDPLPKESAPGPLL